MVEWLDCQKERVRRKYFCHQVVDKGHTNFMRIALLQINVDFGRPEANGRAIEKGYLEAIDLGAELVVAPELAVPGCLPWEGLSDTSAISATEKENQRLTALVGAIPLVFGTCSQSGSGKLPNEIWWCENGKLRHMARKNAQGGGELESIEYLGTKVGLAIGEDLEGTFENHARAGANLVINAVASPAALESYAPALSRPPWTLPSKAERRRKFLAKQAQMYAAPIAYVNRVGADKSVLFDGGSCLVQRDGTWQCGLSFHDGVLLVDTNRAGEPYGEKPDAEGAWLAHALAMGFKDNLTKQGIGAAVIGLSGGIDSAVVAALACRALDSKKILGVSLPTRFTSPESVELARAIAQNLGINYLELDADAPYSSAAASLKRAFPGREFCLTDENLQSRARGVLLMALTTEPDVHRLLGTDRCVVINTGNKSEAATGYFTLYGDGIGAFGPLGDLLKARVYLLADEFRGQIPEQVIKRPPSAELRPGQTDEASLVPYDQLDAVLGAFLEAGRPAELLQDDLADILEGQCLTEARKALPRILEMIKNSEFKRRYLPHALNVTQGNNWPGRLG